MTFVAVVDASTFVATDARTLRQLLETKLPPGALLAFFDEDLDNLVAKGYTTACSLSDATFNDLNRNGVLRPLARAIVKHFSRADAPSLGGM